MSRVGSSATGVSGSSDGWSATPPFRALTNPWLEMTVPSAALESTTTSKVIVATPSGESVGSTGIEPGAGSPGALIEIPSTSGESPPTSETGLPFKVVLPGT